MREDSVAVAFPGLPVIFAEGFRMVDGRRVSLHGHASFAVTSADNSMRTETKVSRIGSGIDFTVNGRPIDGARGSGMKRIVEEMLSKANVASGVKVESNNYNTITGSSDSGAAALVVALNSLLELDLDENELCEVGRFGSETAYRSVVGGLSRYSVDNGVVQASRIKDAAGLLEIVGYGVPFSIPRHSADEIHMRVARHPEYDRRMRVVGERIRMLEERAAKNDFTGILELMEADAREVHKMFDETGVQVIKPPMKRLCATVEAMRKQGVKCYWNVAGGSQVYVFTVKRYADAVESRIEDLGCKFTQLKIAGPAFAKH